MSVPFTDGRFFLTIQPVDQNEMVASQRLDAHVENMVYEPAQVHEHGVDLTVGAIYEIDAPGSLDFGGDELEDADLEPLPTSLRQPDDDHGWWDLAGDQYVFQHNEFVSDLEEPVLVQPRNELLARGGTHPSVQVRSHLPLLPLTVPDGGIRIKENARISTLVPFGRGVEATSDGTVASGDTVTNGG